MHVMAAGAWSLLFGGQMHTPQQLCLQNPTLILWDNSMCCWLNAQFAGKLRCNALSMVVIEALCVPWQHAWYGMQGTAAIEYSWLPRDATPHNWTTEIISDLSLPITFVGLCTIDRRNIYPQKEVSTNPVRLQIVMPSFTHCLLGDLGHAN